MASRRSRRTASGRACGAAKPAPHVLHDEGAVLGTQNQVVRSPTCEPAVQRVHGAAAPRAMISGVIGNIAFP